MDEAAPTEKEAAPGPLDAVAEAELRAILGVDVGVGWGVSPLSASFWR